MKCLAIADLFINAAMMESGLKALRDNGIEVEVREWSHGSVEKLQEDNLRVEQEGAEASCQTGKSAPQAGKENC